MGQTGPAQRLSDAAGRRSTRGLVARFSLRLLADQAGATAVEYGLIVACIFLAIIGGLSLFAGNESNMYNTVSTTIGTAIY
jgi:pilus assembly protein Flp/PilA